LTSLHSHFEHTQCAYTLRGTAEETLHARPSACSRQGSSRRLVVVRVLASPLPSPSAPNQHRPSPRLDRPRHASDAGGVWCRLACALDPFQSDETLPFTLASDP